MSDCDPNIPVWRTFGPNLPNVGIYMACCMHPCGWFASLHNFLGHFRIAEKMGLVPVVNLRDFPSLYNEVQPVDGTMNAWDYFYLQPGNISLEETLTSANVLISSRKYLSDIWNHEENIGTYQKYVRLKPDVQRHVDKVQAELLGNSSVLGVHLRGSDMRTAPGHAIPPTVEQIIATTGKLLDTFPIDRIFLATDESQSVTAMRRHFGSMVMCQDIIRDYNTTDMLNNQIDNLRPLHRYLLALEAIVDVQLLAHSNYLLAGGQNGVASNSSITRVAQYVNNGAYKHVELIFNGFNA